MSDSLAAFAAGLRGVLLKLGASPSKAPPRSSSALIALEAGLAELANAFLPKVVLRSPDQYSAETFVLARAYIVFAHAQLEEYLETIARQRASSALHAAVGGKVDGVTSAILAFHGAKLGFPADLAKYKSRSLELAQSFPVFNRDVDRLVLAQLKGAVDEFNNVVEKNHGVKEPNLLRLFAPLGISPLQMDPVWVAAMDAFGSLRGSHAHSGLSAVSTVSDPFAAQAQLLGLLEGLPGSSAAEGGAFRIYSLRSLDAVLQI